MSPSDRDYDELVRRGLHVAADSVEPAEDGLERIRARLTTPYPVPVAWLMAGYSKVARRARDGLQCVSAWLPTSGDPAIEHFRPALPAGLRSAAVLAIAGFVAAAGALMLTPLPRQAITHAAALIRSFESGGSAGGAGGQRVSGHGTQLPPAGTGLTDPGHGKRNHSQAAPASCAAPTPALASPATSPTASPAPSLTPVASPAASAKPAACPGPAASVIPSVTPPASPTPSGSPSPAPSVTPPASPTPSVTPSVTPPASPTPSVTPSVTPPASPTPSVTPSVTPPPSPTRSAPPNHLADHARRPITLRYQSP
jgi:hypothetical protein